MVVDKKHVNIKLCTLLIILLCFLAACSRDGSVKYRSFNLLNERIEQHEDVVVDTLFISLEDIIADKFTAISVLRLEEQYKIHPENRIVKGEVNYYSEGFIWGADTVVISQLILEDSLFKGEAIRLILVNGDICAVRRIIFNDEQNLFYDFDDINMDYYYLDELYYKDSFYIWPKQPMAWCGTNRQEFVLLIDPDNCVVYEFFDNWEYVSD